MMIPCFTSGTTRLIHLPGYPSVKWFEVIVLDYMQFSSSCCTESFAGLRNGCSTKVRQRSGHRHNKIYLRQLLATGISHSFRPRDERSFLWNEKRLLPQVDADVARNGFRFIDDPP